jgi:hypothetical protein
MRSHKSGAKDPSAYAPCPDTITGVISVRRRETAFKNELDLTNVIQQVNAVPRPRSAVAVTPLVHPVQNSSRHAVIHLSIQLPHCRADISSTRPKAQTADVVGLCPLPILPLVHLDPPTVVLPPLAFETEV